MLPDPVLDVLLHNLPQTQMGLYIHLSQVNRAMRRFFLSDYAWAWFDVHRVGGKGIRYAFGEYTLTGIAAHYFNYLCGLDPALRAWHMYGTRPVWSFSQDLYDQMNYISRLSNKKERKDPWFVTPPESFFYSATVWDLWASQPQNSEWDFEIYEVCPDEVISTTLLDNRTIALSIARVVREPLFCAEKLPDKFRFDHDFTMEFYTRDRWELCHISQLYNVDFMLEALMRYPHLPGCEGDPREDPRIFWSNASEDLVSRLAEKNLNTVIKLVANTPWLLAEEKFPERLRRSVSFVLACVEANLECFAFAENLRGNLTIVGAVMDQSPCTGVRYAAARLRDNRKFVQYAIEREPWCIKFASDRLKRDAALLLYCVARDPHIIEDFSVSTRLRIRLWLKFGRRPNMKIRSAHWTTL